MASKEIDSTDLARPAFTRGALAAAEQQVIERDFSSHVTDVVGMINDGKEATVYLCRARADVCGVEHLAAKMYRARKFRAFASDATYVNPDKIRDRRKAKAMRQRTRHGRAAAHLHWIDREWQMLQLLHGAGASVPKPYLQCSDGILMEYVGRGGERAPTLHELRLSPEQARGAFEQVVRDIEILLDCGVVHGDLSAYNILYLDETPRLIDLPQATRIDDASDPWTLFHRDIANVCEYFRKHGVDVDGLDLALQLWRG
jgi:RIO kinase 1